MTVCHLALGSNIAPAHHLQQAIERLAALPNFDLEARSPCYETAPWGMIQQAAFWNLVLRGHWRGEAKALLQAGQQIESALNRVRTVKNGPRTIDIDILLFGNERLDLAELTVPHPGLYERDFMLVPLLDITPEAIDPISGKPLQEFRAGLPYRCIRRALEGELA